MTIYFVVGSILEEGKMARAFGEAWLAYRDAVALADSVREAVAVRPRRQAAVAAVRDADHGERTV